jgi:hypothetical protein
MQIVKLLRSFWVSCGRIFLPRLKLLRSYQKNNVLQSVRTSTLVENNNTYRTTNSVGVSQFAKVKLLRSFCVWVYDYFYQG